MCMNIYLRSRSIVDSASSYALLLLSIGHTGLGKTRAWRRAPLSTGMELVRSFDVQYLSYFHRAPSFPLSRVQRPDRPLDRWLIGPSADRIGDWSQTSLGQCNERPSLKPDSPKVVLIGLRHVLLAGVQQSRIRAKFPIPIFGTLCTRPAQRYVTTSHKALTHP
jgi:hypothetical protein